MLGDWLGCQLVSTPVINYDVNECVSASRPVFLHWWLCPVLLFHCCSFGVVMISTKHIDVWRTARHAARRQFSRLLMNSKVCLYRSRPQHLWLISWKSDFVLLWEIILGVVGVVGCLSPTPPISRGPKVPNFIGNPLFCLFENKVGCPPCRCEKFERKSNSTFWDIRQNTFDPVCPIVNFQKKKQKTGKRSCVIVLDTPSRRTKLTNNHVWSQYLLSYVLLWWYLTCTLCEYVS